MDFLQVFLSPSAWVAFFALTFLEVVLGMDNIVFLTIMSSKLPKEQQKRGRFVGLFLAMFMRILLLFGVSLLMQLTKPLFTFTTEWFIGTVSAQSIIVFAGGLFLLYKSVTEIHNKLEGEDDVNTSKKKKSHHFWLIIMQILVLDAVFSFDSVLTAVGMVSFNEFGYGGAMAIMVLAIVVSVLIMLLFLEKISKVIEEHPTLQMLALSFLILIAFMLLIEAAHLSQFSVFGNVVGEIPKGYIYFAIGFSLFVEILNQRFSKKSRPVRLHEPKRVKQKKEI